MRGGEEFSRDRVALLEGGLFTVRAVLASLDGVDGGLGKRSAHSFHLAGFSARVETSVEKQCGDTEFAQPTVVQILVRPLNLIGNSKPSSTIAAQDRRPMIFPVICGEQLLGFFAEVLRMGGESFEKGARARLFLEKVESFENQGFTAVGRGQTHHGGDDGAVTVAPKNGTLEAERVEKGNRFKGGAAVKVEWHFAIEVRGVTVARAVGDDDSKLALEGSDLPIEWIDAISPATMEKHQWPATAEFTIVNGDGYDAGGVRRLRQL